MQLKLPSPPNLGLAPVESDEIDFTSMVHTLFKKWRTIAIAAGLGTFVALILVLTARPQFTINSSLYLGDAQSGPDAQNGAPSSVTFLASFQADSNVATQIALIRARPLIEQTILETGLNTSVVRKDAPNLDYWHWRFFYGRSISAFAPKPGDIEALYATLAGQGNSPALFNIIFGNNGAYRIVRFGDLSAAATVLSGKLSQPASGGGLSLLIKPSIDGAIPSPGQQFRLSVLPTSAVADMIVNKGVLSVTADGTLETPTKIANLEMLWGNPYQGMRFVNQLMEDFIASQLSWTTESASATEQYLAQQLENVRLSLAKANYDLATYQSQTGDLDVSENVQAMIKELSQYEVQRTNLQLQQQALEKLSNEMADTSHSLNPFIVSQTNDLVLGQLANSLANAEALLQAHRVQFTSEFDRC